MAHINFTSTFKLNAWSGVKGSVSSVFKIDVESEDVWALLHYVLEELLDTQIPVVKSEKFTLVNLYNPDTGHSAGYSAAPPESVALFKPGLVATFCMDGRAPKSYPADITTLSYTDLVVFFGKDSRNATDWVSINIPRTVLDRAFLSYNTPNDLKYLYNVLGIVSKNYVTRSPRDITKPFDAPANDVDTLQSQYAEMTLNTLFKQVPLEYWAYNRRIWEEAPNLLTSQHLGSHFGLYYILHLLPHVDVSADSPALYYTKKSGNNTIRDYLSKGLRQFHQFVSKKETPASVDDELYAVLHLILLCYDVHGLGEADRMDLVSNIFMKLYVNLEAEDSFKVLLNQHLTGSEAINHLLDPSSTFKSNIEYIFT